MPRYIHNRYEIVKVLGKGGTSQVYLCIDNHINKEWAVKRICCSSNLNLSLASREIEMLKSLDYYLFPRITDAFREGSYYYIVTDYIQGKPLDKIIEESGGLSQKEVLWYSLELIKALRFLHCQSPPVLYLDMKPSNIMVKNDGSIILIDFGIAQSVIEDSYRLGTIGYAPPEQYKAGVNLSESADAFSLGMTIYHMLTGNRPDADFSVQRSLIKQDVDINAGMKRLILGLTECDADERYTLEDARQIISRINNRRRGIMSLSAVAATILTCICIGAGNFVKAESVMKSKNAAMELAGILPEYLENGEYSREGIKVICGYIDGNFLDEKSSEYYTLEVARNLFYIQKDYERAKYYLGRVNASIYPEADFLLNICRELTAFSCDVEEINKNIKDFEEYNRLVSDDMRKKENDKLIDFLHKEAYFEEKN